MSEEPLEPQSTALVEAVVQLLLSNEFGAYKTVKDRFGFQLAPCVRQQPFERKRIFIKLMTLDRNLKASKEDSK